MREAMIAFLAFLGCISVGCHHNVAHNGCGHSCGSCNGGCNSCGSCGLNGGGGLASRPGRHGDGKGLLHGGMHGDGHGLLHGGMHDGHGLRHGGMQGDGQGLLHGGRHGDGHGLGLRSGAPQHVARMPHGPNAEMMGPPGPPTGTYAYPYYTVRAPRDFLLNNPPSIGP